MADASDAPAEASSSEVPTEGSALDKELAATLHEVMQASLEPGGQADAVQAARGDSDCQALREVLQAELGALKADLREMFRDELRGSALDAGGLETRRGLRDVICGDVGEDAPESAAPSGADRCADAGLLPSRPGTAAPAVVGEAAAPLPSPAGAVRDFVPVLSFQARQFHNLMVQLNEVTDQKLPAIRPIAEEEKAEEAVACEPPALEMTLPGQVMDLPSQAKDLQATIRESGMSVEGGVVRARGWDIPSEPPEQRASAQRPALAAVSPPPNPWASAVPWISGAPSRWRIGLQLTPSQQAVARLVRSPRFELVSMLMIVASAAHSGAQANYMAQEMIADLPAGYHVVDIVFMFFFIFELCLRLFAYRLRYFTMWGWGWNLLDLFLVLLQVCEEIAMAVAMAGGPEELRGNMVGGFLLRIVRVLRTVRVVRLFHLARIAAELRLLVTCIVHSAKAFYWASALIMLMVYVFGVLLTQVTALHRMSQGPAETGKLKRWYGTLPRSVLSLFEGLTSGVSWDELIEPLISEISPWLGVVFFMWMAFVILAVMNVVTATFVQQSIERAAQMKEAQKVTQATRLFQALDVDHSGVITFQEIECHLESAAVREFFRTIDVDVSEARLLFDMLDANNSGTIQFTEFLSGCMRLQGPAKAIDMVLVMRELREAIAVVAPGAPPVAQADARAPAMP